MANKQSVEELKEQISQRKHERFWISSYVEAALHVYEEPSAVKRFMGMVGVPTNLDTALFSCLIKDASKKGMGLLVTKPHKQLPIGRSCYIELKFNGVDFKINGIIRNCSKTTEMPLDILHISDQMLIKNADACFCGIEICDSVDNLLQVLKGLKVIEL